MFKFQQLIFIVQKNHIRKCLSVSLFVLWTFCSSDCKRCLHPCIRDRQPHYSTKQTTIPHLFTIHSQLHTPLWIPALPSRGFIRSGGNLRPNCQASASSYQNPQSTLQLHSSHIQMCPRFCMKWKVWSSIQFNSRVSHIICRNSPGRTSLIRGGSVAAGLLCTQQVLIHKRQRSEPELNTFRLFLSLYQSHSA